MIEGAPFWRLGAAYMRVEAFDFTLPAERIAQRPVEPRDASRLLRVTAEGLADHRTLDLPNLLSPGDLLVFNDTRVVPARLTGQRGGARVSITLHQALGPDAWRVFAKPGKRLRIGDLREETETTALQIAQLERQIAAVGSADPRRGRAAGHGQRAMPDDVRVHTSSRRRRRTGPGLSP